MLNIVIPMAGAGSRFAVAGYKEPKPLISVHGVPMIKVVIDNLRPTINHRFIFICQRQHSQEYELETKLRAWAPNSELVLIDSLSQGAACTVLSAKHIINSNDALMIANSDQYIDHSIDSYLRYMDDQNLDALIMCMKGSDPKWSFAAVDKDGNVTRVAEKEAISDIATVGIYNFRRGSDFVKAAEKMIEQRLQVNGEYYVAPVYNSLIEQGIKTGTYLIGTDGNGMHGIGTPTDLQSFLQSEVSQHLKSVSKS
jgi:dTDP-glucose pyrophosphorylase